MHRCILLVLLVLAACDSTAPEEPPVYSHEIAIVSPPDTTLAIDAQPLVVNLHRVFEHKDGIKLTFEPPQVEGASVTMEWQDSLIVLTPTLHGLSSVKLTASALDGARATTTLRVQIEVPDEIVVEHVPGEGGLFVAPSKGLIPVFDVFRHEQGRPLTLSASATRLSGASFSAAVTGDSALIVQGAHEARGRITLTANDRGRTESVTFEARVDQYWCPEPWGGEVSYLPLHEGQHLAFSLQKSGSSSGVGPLSFQESIQGSATWDILTVTCVEGLATYDLRETMQGTLQRSGTGLETIARDTLWTRLFTLTLDRNGQFDLSAYRAFPLVPVFAPAQPDGNLQFEQVIPKTRANSTIWRATFDLQQALTQLYWSDSDGGAGFTSRSLYQLTRQ